MINSRTNVCYYIYEAYPQGAIIVTMAVRFFAESYSSDYIETLWESDGKQFVYAYNFRPYHSSFAVCYILWSWIRAWAARFQGKKITAQSGQNLCGYLN